MTATEPQRLSDALPAVLAVWQDETGQAPPMAVFCAAEHPTTRALCPVVGPHEVHDPDGEDAWASNRHEQQETA